MTAPTDAQRRSWMAQWHSAAIELARVRQSELSQTDLARVAADLEDACLAAASVRGRSTTSGLIEQQRLLHSRPVA